LVLSGERNFGPGKTPDLVLREFGNQEPAPKPLAAIKVANPFDHSVNVIPVFRGLQSLS
jgi:hypothetical protein